MKIATLSLLLATTAAAFSPLPASTTVPSRSSWMQRSMTAANTALGKPGTAQLDVPWEELGFEFRPTKSHIRIVYKNGDWGPTELVAVSFVHSHTHKFDKHHLTMSSFLRIRT